MRSFLVEHFVTGHRVLYFTYLFLVLPTVSDTMTPICCFPVVYEASLFGMQVEVQGLDDRYGDAYAYVNASMRTAYDAVNQRTYTHTDTWVWVSYQGMTYFNQTNIVDYKNNVHYRVFENGNCEAMKAEFQLYRECIPGNATLMSVGNLGNGVQVKTYLFRDLFYSDPFEITATVMHSADDTSECVPVRATYSHSYQTERDVDIAYADIVDVTRGIRDKAIFTPPPNCNSDVDESSDNSQPTGVIALPFIHVNRIRSLAKLVKTSQNEPHNPRPFVS